MTTKSIFSEVDYTMFKYVLAITFVTLLATCCILIITIMANYDEIKTCEAKYHEPCSLIAIPKSVKDMTGDR